MTERLVILLNREELKPSEFEEMVDLAVEELAKSGIDSNFLGCVLCLKNSLWNGYEKARYIRKVEVAVAQERIGTLIQFKELGLLK